MLSLPESQKQHNNKEPNAFDLTWRNYLPSTSQLCLCIPFFGQRQGILLDDDHNNNTEQILTSPYYNDFYQAKAVRGYLGDQLDREFDDLLLNANTEIESSSSLKSTSRKSNAKQHHQPDTDETDSMDKQEVTIDLGDGQIDKAVDSYEQGMDYSRHTGMYTPQSIANSIHSKDDQERISNDGQPGTASDLNHPSPLSNTTTEGPILSDKLEGLAEKLVFIRNNMKDIGSLSIDQDETTVVRPLTKWRTSKRFETSSDFAAPFDYQYQRKSSMVSISSNDYYNRRLSYNLAPGLCMRADALESTSVGQHGFFNYFDDQDDDDDTDKDEHNGSGIQDAVF